VRLKKVGNREATLKGENNQEVVQIIKGTGKKLRREKELYRNLIGKEVEVRKSDLIIIKRKVVK